MIYGRTFQPFGIVSGGKKVACKNGYLFQIIEVKNKMIRFI